MEDVLSTVYAVASGDVGWPDVAAKLSTLLDGERVVLFVLEAQAETIALLGSSTPNLDSIPEHFLHVARRAGRRLKARVPTTGVVGARFPKAQRHIIEDLAAWNSVVEMEAGYVTARLLRVWESAYFCLAVGDDEPGHDVSLRRRQLADTLLPHLARAAELERRLQSASAQFNVFSQILDRFPVAAISLDHHGAVTHLNAAALRLSQLRSGLMISRAGVHATNEANEAQLQRCITEAIANRTGDYFRRLNIGRRKGPCGVVVTSMHSDGSSSDSQSPCVLFVADPDLQPIVTPEALSDVLGLTTAEARIVAELVTGHSLAEAAERLGITANTGRTLLGRAMARTGTNSQAEIVRRVFTTMVPVYDET